MLASSTVFIISLVYTAAFSVAQIGPTTPGPNETFKAGSPCKIAWIPDSSGSWTNMTIGMHVSLTFPNLLARPVGG